MATLKKAAQKLKKEVKKAKTYAEISKAHPKVTKIHPWDNQQLTRDIYITNASSAKKQEAKDNRTKYGDIQKIKNATKTAKKTTAKSIANTVKKKAVNKRVAQTKKPVVVHEKAVPIAHALGKPVDVTYKNVKTSSGKTRKVYSYDRPDNAAAYENRKARPLEKLSMGVKGAYMKVGGAKAVNNILKNASKARKKDEAKTVVLATKLNAKETLKTLKKKTTKKKK